MTMDISAAPGCYGMGMLFKVESGECKTCPFAATCGPIATEQLTRLRAELGITVKQKPPAATRARSGEVTVSPTGITSYLPKKVLEHMEWIERAEINVTECLARGVNPFPSGPKGFLRATCHMLLSPRAPDGITRDQLMMAFMSPKVAHSRGAAAAHVLQAIQVLTAIGAAEEINGTLKLRKFQ
jgi:hypothetical protein